MYVYTIPEEVLSSNQALWMSDDGHLMLYATFNDTLVEEQRFPWFAVQDEGKLYPEIRSLRYPKVKCLSLSV
jgi:hypothetical protein